MGIRHTGHTQFGYVLCISGAQHLMMQGVVFRLELADFLIPHHQHLLQNVVAVLQG